MSDHHERERALWSKALTEGRARRVEVKPRRGEGRLPLAIEQLHALERREAKRIRRLFSGFKVRIEIDPDIGQMYVYVMQHEPCREAGTGEVEEPVFCNATQLDDRLGSIASQIAAAERAMIGVENGQAASHEAFEEVREQNGGAAFDAAIRQAHMPPLEVTIGHETVSLGGHPRAYRPIKGHEFYELVVEVQELSRKARPNGRATLTILENRSMSSRFDGKLGKDIEVRLQTPNDARSVEILAEAFKTMQRLPVKVSDYISTRSLKIVYLLRALG